MSSSIKPIYGFTGVILEYMIYHAPGGNPINKADKTLSFFGTGDEVTIYCSVEDLSAYTIQAISEPNAAEGGIYNVESFRCSNRELAAMYEEVRGVKLELKCFGSVEDLDKMLEHARATIPRTRFMEYNAMAFGTHFIRGSLNFDAVDSSRWSHIKQTGLKEWLEKNPDA